MIWKLLTDGNLDNDAIHCILLNHAMYASEPDFDDPENQKLLLQGFRLVTCPACNLYWWADHKIFPNIKFWNRAFDPSKIQEAPDDNQPSQKR